MVNKWIRNSVAGLTALVSGFSMNQTLADNTEINKLEPIDYNQLILLDNVVNNKNTLFIAKLPQDISDQEKNNQEKIMYEEKIDVQENLKLNLSDTTSVKVIKNTDLKNKKTTSIKLGAGPVMFYGDRLVGKNPFIVGANGLISLEQQISKYFSLEAGLVLGKFEFDNNYAKTRLREWSNQEFVYMIGSILGSKQGQNNSFDVKLGAGLKLFHSEARQIDLTNYGLISQTGGNGYFLDREMFVVPSLKLILEGKVNSKISTGLEIGKDIVFADRMLDAIDSKNVDDLYFLNLFVKYNLVNSECESSNIFNNSKLKLVPLGGVLMYSDYGSVNKILPDRDIGKFYSLEFQKQITNWLSVNTSISFVDYAAENKERDVKYDFWLKRFGGNLGVDISKLFNKSQQNSYLTLLLGGSVDLFESELRELSTNKWLAQKGRDRQGNLFGNEVQGTLDVGLRATIALSKKLGIYYQPEVMMVFTNNDDYDASRLGKGNEFYALISPLALSISINEKNSNDAKLKTGNLKDKVSDYDFLVSQEKMLKENVFNVDSSVFMIIDEDTINNKVMNNEVKVMDNEVRQISETELVEQLGEKNNSNQTTHLNLVKEIKPQSESIEYINSQMLLTKDEGINYLVKPGDVLQNIVKQKYDLKDNIKVVEFSNVVAKINSSMGRKYMARDAYYTNELGETIKEENRDGQVGDIIKDTVYLPSRNTIEQILESKQTKNSTNLIFKNKSQDVDLKKDLVLDVVKMYDSNDFVTAKKLASMMNQDIYGLINYAADLGIKTKTTLKALELSNRAEEMAGFLSKKYWSSNSIDEALRAFSDEFNRDISKNVMYKFMDLHNGADKLRKNKKNYI